MNDDLETLLRERDNSKANLAAYKDSLDGEVPPRLKSDKGASLFDCIKMINKLVSLYLKDLKAEFSSEEGKILDVDAARKQVDNPKITYKVISRVPINPKPMERDQVNEDNGDTVMIYSQRFKCEVQFNVLASTYDLAEKVMERFEEMILVNTGYLKKNGVQQIFFKSQYTDDTYQRLRQVLSIRNFSYYIEVEKNRVIVNSRIKKIEDDKM